jgi:hypothetical protein
MVYKFEGNTDIPKTELLLLEETQTLYIIDQLMKNMSVAFYMSYGFSVPLFLTI